MPITPPKKAKASPSKEELKMKISEQKKKIKILQQKVRRHETKINSLSSIVDDLKEKCLVDQSTALKLNESFSGLTMDIIQNQLKNQNRDPKGRPYKHAILGYIGGYIVRKLARKISCKTCYQAMIACDGNVTQHWLILSKD